MRYCQTPIQFINLPKEDADAIKMVDIYQHRWGIETAFQKLEKYLNSEINTKDKRRTHYEILAIWDIDAMDAIGI